MPNDSQSPTIAALNIAPGDSQSQIIGNLLRFWRKFIGVAVALRNFAFRKEPLIGIHNLSRKFSVIDGASVIMPLIRDLDGRINFSRRNRIFPLSHFQSILFTRTI